MIHVRQHIPGFVDGVTPEAVDVADAAELLALPWVRTWSEHPGFYRYSESPYTAETRLLMAEFEAGGEWWVLAYLRGAATGLPQWREPEWSEP